MKFNKSNNQLNIAEIEQEEPDNSIMVVDDSKFARNILCDILRNDGFHVVAEAKNGLEAVELTKEKKPKYIFLDVEMPMLDGLGAIPRILEVDPEAHIIMCTAMGQKNIIVEAAKAGAKDYVIKPYKKENILRVLNVIIESKRKPVTILESDTEIDAVELPNHKQQVQSKQENMRAKYLIPQSEKPEYTEPKYIEPEYKTPENERPEFIEAEYKVSDNEKAENLEAEYRSSDNEKPEYIEAEYKASDNEEPEYLEAEYKASDNEKVENKEAEYNASDNEKPENTESEYKVSDNEEPEYIEAEYKASDNEKLEDIEAEYKASDIEKPEYIEPEYKVSDNELPEYIESEIKVFENEKAELKEDLKPLTYRDEAETILENDNEQQTSTELELEPKISSDFVELLSLPEEAEAVIETENSDTEPDATLAGDEAAASAMIDELVLENENLPELENTELSAEIEVFKEAEVIIDNSETIEAIQGTEENESLNDNKTSEGLTDNEKVTGIEENENILEFPEAAEAKQIECVLESGEASETVEALDLENTLEFAESSEAVEETEYIPEIGEALDAETEESAELIEILGSEEDSELKFLLEAIADYDYCEGIGEKDTTNLKPVRLRPVIEASRELLSEVSADYYSYTYLFRDRFDIKPEEILTRPVSEQRMPFHNVVQLKRNDSFLTDIDNSCNGILSGLASAYLGRKKRLQTDELGISMDKQANYYQDGARVFINTIMEDKSGDNADIAMSDLLMLSETKEQNKVMIQVKSLSDAVRQLVCRKAGRNLM